MKVKFNKYCAEVMNYTQNADNGYWYEEGKYLRFVSDYEPYDDLNQMAEVVEKLVKLYGIDYAESVITLLSIKQSFRDFIASTQEQT